MKSTIDMARKVDPVTALLLDKKHPQGMSHDVMGEVMAQLPYTYTICPPQEEPKRFTASCKEMGELLRHSLNGDLTINQRRTATWDVWSGNHMGVIEEKLMGVIEEKLHEICTKNKEKKNECT